VKKTGYKKSRETVPCKLLKILIKLNCTYTVPTCILTVGHENLRGSSYNSRYRTEHTNLHYHT